MGDVDAGASAAAVTLGLYDGSVTAGDDAYLISEQTIGGGATAGRDVSIWAIGNVSGIFAAGRDAQLTTYGASSADVTTDRDVRYVWARGNISGTIDAGRNIGGGAYISGQSYYGHPGGYDIFSYGSISAQILATAGSAANGGGNIGGVAAWGSIQGQVEASESIGVVRSGASVGATIIAPVMPAIIENDSTIFTDFPYPETPASVKAEVLAEAAAVYAELVATKAEIAADIAEFFADFAIAKADEAARIVDLRDDVISEVAAAVAQANTELAADQATATSELQQLQDTSFQMLHAARQSAAEDKAMVIELRDAAIFAGDIGYQNALNGKSDVLATLAAGDAEMSTLRDGELAESDKARQRRELGWDDFIARMAQASLLGFRVDLTPPPEPEPPISLYEYYLTHRNMFEDLEAFQLGLDACGLRPGGVGMACDAISLVISIYQGDWEGVGASAVSMLPLGELYKGYKFLRAGLKYSDEIANAVGTAKVNFASRSGFGAKGLYTPPSGIADDAVRRAYLGEVDSSSFRFKLLIHNSLTPFHKRTTVAAVRDAVENGIFGRGPFTVRMMENGRMLFGGSGSATFLNRQLFHHELIHVSQMIKNPNLWTRFPQRMLHEPVQILTAHGLIGWPLVGFGVWYAVDWWNE